MRRVLARRCRGFAGRLVLIVLGVTVGLIGSEVLIRVLGVAPEVVVVSHGMYRLSSNQRRGYEPIPKEEYGESLPEIREYPEQETNHLGYRGRGYAIENSSEAYRIVVLGDSIAAGLWVKKYGDTFPAIIERHLGSRGMRVEVLNFGVVGYNTLQEVETLKDEALRYKPDLVIVAYCLNDRVRDDGLLLEKLLVKERTIEGANWVREHRYLVKSALYRFIVYNKWFPDEGIQRASEARRLRADTTDEAFLELSHLAEERDFAVFLALFPDFSQLKKYRRISEHRVLRKLAEQHGFLFLDLLRPMKKCRQHLKKSQTLGFDRYHPNENGHRCAARAMSRFLWRVLIDRKIE